MPRRRGKPGTPPGTLTPNPQAPPPTIRVVAYGPTTHDEATLTSVAELRGWLTRPGSLWVDVAGLGDVDAIRQLGELFGLHPLALEDVVNTHQRPKLEQYGEHLFAVARMLHDQQSLESEQLALFVAPRFVVTFQERLDDDLAPVRERLRRPGSLVRERGTDYLAYAILDDVVDHYFPVLDRLGERLEGLEERITEGGGAELLHQIRDVKHDLQVVRRAAWPLRDLLNAALRETSAPVTAETRLYLRDCHDHTVQAMDLVETYREIANGLMDLYLSTMSYKTNEVMKVLALIATIFIPLTFVAGIYGMNFDPASSPWNMPELDAYWGYPLVLTAMAAVGATMVLYFKRRRWL